MANTYIPSKDTIPSTEPNNPDLATQSLELSTTEIAARSASSTLLEEILSRADDRHHDHWGINE
jgi:hypothetical protein